MGRQIFQTTLLLPKTDIALQQKLITSLKPSRVFLPSNYYFYTIPALAWWNSLGSKKLERDKESENTTFREDAFLSNEFYIRKEKNKQTTMQMFALNNSKVFA